MNYKKSMSYLRGAVTYTTAGIVLGAFLGFLGFIILRLNSSENLPTCMLCGAALGAWMGTYHWLLFMWFIILHMIGQVSRAIKGDE